MQSPPNPGSQGYCASQVCAQSLGTLRNAQCQPGLQTPEAMEKGIILSSVHFCKALHRYLCQWKGTLKRTAPEEGGVEPWTCRGVPPRIEGPLRVGTHQQVTLTMLDEEDNSMSTSDWGSFRRCRRQQAAPESRRSRSSCHSDDIPTDCKQI